MHHNRKLLDFVGQTIRTRWNTPTKCGDIDLEQALHPLHEKGQCASAPPQARSLGWLPMCDSVRNSGRVHCIPFDVFVGERES